MSTLNAQATSKPTKALFSALERQAAGESSPEVASLDSSTEYTFRNINAPNYSRSTFPSLLNSLGTKATNRPKGRPRHKKHSSGVLTRPVRLKREPETTTYFEDAQRRNESHWWARIETVAKETMNRYEKYATDMELKLRRQRAEISRRGEQLLQKLYIEEEKKKQDRMLESSHGRIWRHHRTMQRRAFSLEPMRPPRVQRAKSQRTRTPVM